MPRLVAGSVGQSYIVRGYSNGSEGNGDNHLINGGGDNNNSKNHLLHTASTPQYRTNRTMSESYIAEAPSSGTGLPQLSTYLEQSKSEHDMNPPAVPKTPSSLKSTSGAPLSLKTTRSLFGSTTSSSASRRHSSATAISPRNNRAYASDKELPTTVYNSDMAPRKPNRILRAAEGGKGTLLPDFNRNNSSSINGQGGGGANKRVSIGERRPPDRSQTRSSPSLKNAMNLPSKMMRGGKRSESQQQLPQTHQDTIPKQSVLQAAKQSILRKRNASTSYASGDEYDEYSTSVRENTGGGTTTSGHRSSDNESTSYHSRSRDRRRASRRSGQSFSSNLSWKISSMKLGNILQVVIVLAVTALVWESHHKALFAAQQLTQFKEEESLLLLHLQKIEQQSIQLHENLGRLAESGMKTSDQQNNNNNVRGGDGAGGGVDFDLIHKQTQQLYQMEEELNTEVRTLQQRIQQSARKHVIQEFGEGPVQVILEIDFGTDDAQQGPKMIAILLWHDTPHAAWTWLEQIGRHVWDNSEFSWEQGQAISAAPSRDDPMAGGKIEFVEQSQHGHEAWTVGLHENDAGKLSMYINLADNTNLHKHETCVGKVIDGFDALQKLLEVARNRKNDSNSKNRPPIQIRKATAMHVTKKEGP